MPPAPQVHGFLVVDKSPGMTSHDVVGQVRRLFSTKRVGHIGTLDPEATGVLVMCIGNATRLAEYLNSANKTYDAGVRFGIETDTQDVWGEVTARSDAEFLSRELVEAALAAFRGPILQVPPMVSALKRDGVRLYELARRGITVDREARPVEIIHLELTSFIPGSQPSAEITVSCSSGTYIRTLAHDLGAAVGTGAAMSALQRTKVQCESCVFDLCGAHTLDFLETAIKINGADPASLLLPLVSGVSAWPAVQLSADQETDIRFGKELQSEDSLPGAVGEMDMIALLGSAGELVAVARRTENGTIRPVKVMARE